jgi:release factor glutamine methyltransferase
MARSDIKAPVRAGPARGTPASDHRPGPIDPSVYPVREDTELLLRFADARATGWLVEVGCGSGAAALRAARRGWRVVATDLNPAALARLREAARREGLTVAAVRTDLLAGLGRADRILANPPYLPTGPGEADPDPWVDLALNGGTDGCAVTARLLHQLADHLAPGGRAYLLASSRQSPARLAALLGRWRASGGTVAVVDRRPLEGERLEVLELARDAKNPTRAARPPRGPPRGSAGRPPAPPARPPWSNPARAADRSRARGAASGRRRSPRGS